MGTFLALGSYDDVVETYRQLHEAGLDGVAVGMIDYIADQSNACATRCCRASSAWACERRRGLRWPEWRRTRPIAAASSPGSPVWRPARLPFQFAPQRR